jgi:tetratricopeptide (TPR) repeat protein
MIARVLAAAGLLLPLLLAACSVSGTTRALAYYRKARTYHRDGNFDRAIAYYDTTLTLFARPLATEIFTDRGEAYYGKGMMARAIADFDSALMIFPDAPRARADRGASYLRLKQPNRAVIDLTSALRLEPKLTWARYRRAHAWVAMDSLSRAIADLDTVLMAWKDREDIKVERAQLRARVRH